MKDNCKNRKLRFIRNKNNLRLGITKFYCVAKVTPETNLDVIYEYMSNMAKKSLMKEYKLSLPVVKVDTFEDHNDFITNKTTVRFTLSKYN